MLAKRKITGDPMFRSTSGGTVSDRLIGLSRRLRYRDSRDNEAKHLGQRNGFYVVPEH